MITFIISAAPNIICIVLADGTRVPSQLQSEEQKLITNTEEMALFISMAAIILVLLIAVIVIVSVIRRIKGQVKKWNDDEKALPRVNIRSMSELGHAGSIDPAYRSMDEQPVGGATASGETTA